MGFVLPAAWVCHPSILLGTDGTGRAQACHQPAQMGAEVIKAEAPGAAIWPASWAPTRR